MWEIQLIMENHLNFRIFNLNKINFFNLNIKACQFDWGGRLLNSNEGIYKILRKKIIFSEILK